MRHPIRQHLRRELSERFNGGDLPGKTTAKRTWAYARAWLFKEIRRQ